jgi:putative membrane protein
MHDHSVAGSTNSSMFELAVYALPLIPILLYITAVLLTNKKYRKWPVARLIFWTGGILSVSLAIIGPIAEKSHMDFQVHMLGHLLLGMLGPLLLVLAAPMTLLLRVVPVKAGRIIGKLLRSAYGEWVTHPLNTAIFNIGGLWILYTTDLYQLMHMSLFFYVLIHVHVFVAGYLFTLSILYIDPVAHRMSFHFRASILILAMAGHSILSKWIYANPPAGVAEQEAQAGGMLMYYGGDLIDFIIVILLCRQHFKGRKRVANKQAYIPN